MTEKLTYSKEETQTALRDFTARLLFTSPKKQFSMEIYTSKAAKGTTFGGQFMNTVRGSAQAHSTHSVMSEGGQVPLRLFPTLRARSRPLWPRSAAVWRIRFAHYSAQSPCPAVQETGR